MFVPYDSTQDEEREAIRRQNLSKALPDFLSSEDEEA